MLAPPHDTVSVADDVPPTVESESRPETKPAEAEAMAEAAAAAALETSAPSDVLARVRRESDRAGQCQSYHESDELCHGYQDFSTSLDHSHSDDAWREVEREPV